MDRTEVIKRVTDALNEAAMGLAKEYPKLDFKAKWYELKQEADKYEFLKDASSLANTVGLDAFIVIGYDDKANAYHDAKFSDSGLKDTNELSGIIVKNCDGPFIMNVYDEIINGHSVSILHIPPSFDKPHVLRSYKTKNGNMLEHTVWVRRGTECKIATKYDHDFMAYDKKNVLPEYQLFLTASSHSMYMGSLSLTCQLPGVLL